jgi:hypothetical protein
MPAVHCVSTPTLIGYNVGSILTANGGLCDPFPSQVSWHCEPVSVIMLPAKLACTIAMDESAALQRYTDAMHSW